MPDTPEQIVALTGDCEIDCQERCAYPGEFSECELGVPVGSGEDTDARHQ